MKIKKYTAPSMRHALMQIKEELGEDAIILKTRRMPKKLFSLAGQEEIEVTAAVDNDASTPQRFAPLKVPETAGVYQKTAKPAPAFPEYVKSRARVVPRGASDDPETPKSPAVSGRQIDFVELKEDVRELKELVRSIVDKSTGAAPAGEFTGGWATLFRKLVDAEVKPDIAQTLVKSMQQKSGGDSGGDDKALSAALAAQFPVSGPIRLNDERPIRIAFVGPTGSGKTTTLAKLGAHLMLNKQKQVSIITADTYRIAAIEQIRTFADIVNIGLQVIFSPDEVAGAIESCENDDAVLVDTAGRSQRNAEHMKHLEDLLAVLKPDETHLVLSSATKDADLLDMIERYRGLGVNRLLFTKLDETTSLGNVFNVVSRSAIPVSYFTFGQSIPEDIELAQPARFIQWLWEGRRS